MHSKFLRVHQENECERVGESRPRKIDVRILAATNRELKEAVANGSFRSDLYYRLNVFPLEIVPLRSRVEDIAELAQRFLNKAKTQFNRPLLRLSRANIKDLEHYFWPGNVRELQNVIERAAIVSNGKTLILESLDTQARAPFSTRPASEAHPEILTDAEMKAMARTNVTAAMNECQGRIYGPSGAATLLGMKPTTLSSYIKKHNLGKATGSERDD